MRRIVHEPEVLIGNCLNRLLMFECHPQVYLTRELCKNMMVQKRQSPPKVYHPLCVGLEAMLKGYWLWHSP
jgi:hypothetical protein